MKTTRVLLPKPRSFFVQYLQTINAGYISVFKFYTLMELIALRAIKVQAQFVCMCSLL